MDLLILSYWYLINYTGLIALTQLKRRRYNTINSIQSDFFFFFIINPTVLLEDYNLIWFLVPPSPRPPRSIINELFYFNFNHYSCYPTLWTLNAHLIVPNIRFEFCTEQIFYVHNINIGFTVYEFWRFGI